MVQRIRWKGSNAGRYFPKRGLLLVGSKREGAICTRFLYDNFLPSLAHLHKNGMVIVYGQQVGTVKDIQFLRKAK